jgi:thymidylate synthase ThyX
LGCICIKWFGGVIHNKNTASFISFHLEAKTMDALDLVPNKKIQCLDLGFVELIDVMPRIVPDGQTCDYAICQMARLSYQHGTKTVNEDKGLLNLLMRNSHVFFLFVF